MSESRKPSWIDYSNMTANLVQTAQLSAVQEHLRDLLKAEASWQERQKRLSELRQEIFEIENNLEQLRKGIDTAPLGVFFLISMLKSWVNFLGITPEIFDEFSDKDRVKSLRDRIQNLESEVRAQLSEEELSEAQRRIELLPKDNKDISFLDLDTLISALEAKEELVRTEPELKRLEMKAKRKALPWYFLTFISIVALPGSCCAWGNEEMGVSALVGLASFIGLVVGAVQSRKQFKDVRTFTEYRNNLQKRLLPVEKYKAMVARFGERTLEEYKEIRNDFQEYLRRVTAYDRQGNPLSFP